MATLGWYSGGMTVTEKPIPTPDQMLLDRVQWVVDSINALTGKAHPEDTQNTASLLASMVADDLEAIAGTVRRRWVRCA